MVHGEVGGDGVLQCKEEDAVQLLCRVSQQCSAVQNGVQACAGQ
jgi:hypothetical protein